MGPRLSTVVGLSALIACTACTETTETAGTRAAVYDGTPSSVPGVVLVLRSSGGTCGGTVVGDRWVVTPAFCTVDPPVYIATSLPPGGPDPVEAVRIHEGPFVAEAGPDGIGVNLVEVAEPLGITPVPLSEATPAVDDDVAIVGYGDMGGASDAVTEGAFTVTMVTDSEITLEPAGTARSCVGDQTVLDETASLAGILAYGSMDPTVSSCFELGVAIRTSVFRDFVNTTIDAAPDDAGVAEDGGGVAPDAGASDGGGIVPPADGGPPPPSPIVDDGCACSPVGASSSGPRAAGALALAALLLSVVARRRRRR